MSHLFRWKSRFNPIVSGETTETESRYEVPAFDPRKEYTRQVQDRRIRMRLASLSAETSQRLGSIPYASVLNCISWNWLNLECGVQDFAHRNRMAEIRGDRSLAPSFATENTLICLTENGSLLGLLPSGPDLHYESISLRPDFLMNQHRKLKTSCCFENVRIYSNIRCFAPLSTSAMLTSAIVRIYCKSGMHKNAVDRMKDLAFTLRLQGEESAKKIASDAA